MEKVRSTCDGHETRYGRIIPAALTCFLSLRELSCGHSGNLRARAQYARQIVAKVFAFFPPRFRFSGEGRANRLPAALPGRASPATLPENGEGQVHHIVVRHGRPRGRRAGRPGRTAPASGRSVIRISTVVRPLASVQQFVPPRPGCRSDASMVVARSANVRRRSRSAADEGRPRPCRPWRARRSQSRAKRPSPRSRTPRGRVAGRCQHRLARGRSAGSNAAAAPAARRRALSGIDVRDQRRRPYMARASASPIMPTPPRPTSRTGPRPARRACRLSAA